MITTDHDKRSSAGVTPLVTGIIDDAQTLVHQHLALFKGEVRADLARLRDAAIAFQAGIAISLLAGGFIFLALGELAMRIWPGLPAFAVHGVIGLVLGVVAVSLLLIARHDVDTIQTPTGATPDNLARTGSK